MTLAQKIRFLPNKPHCNALLFPAEFGSEFGKMLLLGLDPPHCCLYKQNENGTGQGTSRPLSPCSLLSVGGTWRARPAARRSWGWATRTTGPTASLPLHARFESSLYQSRTIFHTGTGKSQPSCFWSLKAVFRIRKHLDLRSLWPWIRIRNLLDPNEH